MLSEAATHRAWCNKLINQQGGLTTVEESLRIRIEHQWASMLGISWVNRGKGHRDCEVSNIEVSAVVAAWKTSAAIPVDLLVRAAFKCGCPWWDALVLALLQLTGPGGWALRPSLWKWVSLGTTLKGGDPSEMENWRLLFIRCQMGLLQEAVLANRKI